MAMPAKPVPLKHCNQCSKPLVRGRYSSGVLESVRDFMRRRYCDQTCMGLGGRTLEQLPCGSCGIVFRPKNSSKQYCGWECKVAAQVKRDAGTVLANASRDQARKITARVSCQRCGTMEKLVVHHQDENPLNNEPSNHEVLCVTCHGVHHNPQIRPTQSCFVCGRLMAKNYKRYGMLCDKHYRRCKKHGSPYLVKARACGVGVGIATIIIQRPT